MTFNDKAILGHYLFFEKKLSFNNTKSCSSCHSPNLAFTDGYRRSVAANGENLLHNAPTLLNIANNHFFDWNNPSSTTLAQQIKGPLYNTHPTEMGMDTVSNELENYLSNDTMYLRLFRTCFKNEKKLFTASQIEQCIIQYVKGLQHTESKYDKYKAGDTFALSENEKKGMQLFFGTIYNCNSCHTAPAYTRNLYDSNIDIAYASNKIHYKTLWNKYDVENLKLKYNSTDSSYFKIPTLRNIMLTTPYMHDGNMQTIQEVLKNYKVNMNDKNENEKDQQFIIQFLNTLTDTAYLQNQYFNNPFQK